MNDPRRLIYGTLLCLAAIATTAFALSYPLFFTGYNLGHSGEINILYADQFIRSLHSGVILPGWMRDANEGYGSPIYIFYQPLIFYVIAFIAMLVPDVPLSVNMAAFVALISSGLAIFLFAREYYGRSASLLVSVLYMALPYHLVDMYERAALSEHWSFVWMPLILYFTKRAASLRYRDLAGLALSYALLVPTHLPTPLLFTPFLLAYFAHLYFQERSRAALIQRVAGLMLGIGLSCFYLVAAMLDQGYIKIQKTFSGWFYYANNFLFAGGAGDMQMLLRLNMIAVGAAALLLVAMALALIKCASSTASESRGFMLFISVTGLISVLMATPLTLPLWKLAPVIQKVQFPWRYLAYATLAMSMSTGAIFTVLKDEGWRVLRHAAIAAVAALLAFNFYYSAEQYGRYRHMPFVDGLSTPKWTPNMEMPFEDFMAYAEQFAPGYKRMSMPIELTPAWSKNKGGVIYVPRIDGSAYFMSGRGEARSTLWEPENRELEIDAHADSRVLIRTLYYPNWRAELDGTPVDPTPDPYTGLISFNVKEGSHKLSLSFGRSPNQKAGIAISLASLLLLLALASKRLRSILGMRRA